MNVSQDRHPIIVLKSVSGKFNLNFFLQITCNYDDNNAIVFSPKTVDNPRNSCFFYISQIVF